MRAEILQIVALSSHSAPFLRGSLATAPELFPAHLAFRNVQSLDFMRGTNSSGVVAESVAPWLRRLASEGVLALTATLTGAPITHHLPATQPWGLVADGDRGLELWQPEWRRRSSTQEQQVRYIVSYSASRILRTTLPARIPIAVASKNFYEATVRLIDFCRNANLEQPLVLLDAWQRLHDATPGQMGPARDILRPDVSEAAVSLCGSVIRFGEILTTPIWSESNVTKTDAGKVAVQNVWNTAMTALESIIASE